MRGDKCAVTNARSSKIGANDILANTLSSLGGVRGGAPQNWKFGTT